MNEHLIMFLTQAPDNILEFYDIYFIHVPWHCLLLAK